MSKAKEALVDWIVGFIKHRDAINNNLIKIEEDKDGFDIKAVYNNKEEYVIADPFIKDFEKVVDKITKDKIVILVLFNTNENFDIIVENWKRLIDFDKLTIFFVNMFSSLDTKWIIKPYLHHRICDEKSLKTGLKSMFSMVEPITEEEAERKSLNSNIE